jgi:hypothetical protein
MTFFLWFFYLRDSIFYFSNISTLAIISNNTPLFITKDEEVKIWHFFIHDNFLLFNFLWQLRFFFNYHNHCRSWNNALLIQLLGVEKFYARITATLLQNIITTFNNFFLHDNIKLIGGLNLGVERGKILKKIKG